MPKAKILFTVTVPDWGGAQFYLINLAENLKNDYDITVAFGQSDSYDASIFKQRCDDMGIKWHQFKSLKRSEKPLEDIRALWEIFKFIKNERPEIVFSHSSKAGILTAFATILSKIIIHKPHQMAHTVHGWVFEAPNISLLKKNLYILLEWAASKCRDKIFVLGKNDEELALKYHFCNKKKLIRHFIPYRLNNISFLNQEESRKELKLPTNKKMIGTIANFFEVKGLNFLIDAAARNKDDDVIFGIIGDGSLRRNLENQIKQLNLQNKVYLLGSKIPASKYIKAFDIFVLPSIKEGMPYVLAEAMLAQLPIVSSNVGNIEEMLEGYKYNNKILIPPGDINKLSSAISSMLNTLSQQEKNINNINLENNNINLEKKFNEGFEIVRKNLHIDSCTC